MIGVTTMTSTAGTRPMPLAVRQKPLGNDAAQGVGQLKTDLVLLMRRKHIDDRG